MAFFHFLGKFIVYVFLKIYCFYLHFLYIGMILHRALFFTIFKYTPFSSLILFIFFYFHSCEFLVMLIINLFFSCTFSLHTFLCFSAFLLTYKNAQHTTKYQNILCVIQMLMYSSLNFNLVRYIRLSL